MQENRSAIRSRFFQRPNRIFIIPTVPGTLLTGIVIALLLTAAGSGDTKGNILAVVLVTLAILAMFMTHGNLGGLQARVGDLFMPEGSGADLDIELTNHGDSPRFALVVGTDLPDTGSSGPCLVKQEGSCSLSLPVGERRRCLEPVTRIRVSSTYPFGLFRAWMVLPVSGSLVVYPRPAGSAAGREEGDGRGEAAGRQSGHEDFLELRPFVRGDSLNHIDWKARARGRPLLVRQYQGGGGARRHLRWQDTPQKDNEAKLSQLSRWLHDIRPTESSYSLEIPGRKTPAARGEAHFHRCLKELAGFDAYG